MTLSPEMCLRGVLHTLQNRIIPSLADSFAVEGARQRRDGNGVAGLFERAHEQCADARDTGRRCGAGLQCRGRRRDRR